MITNWKYLLDQMELETADNVSKAVTLSRFHDSALLSFSATMPGMLYLYNRYHPLHVDFITGYANLESKGGAKQGNRQSVDELLVTSKDSLTEDWLPAILQIYKKKSARYKALFPKGMLPFNTKGIDARIAAYDTLSKNMGDDVALTAIKGEVDTVYANLLETRSTQSGAKTITKNTSNDLDTLRIAAMEMQYRNLGYIMDNYFDVKDTLCPMVFDLVTLRTIPQTVFTGKTAIAMQRSILAHTFVATDTMSVKFSQNAKLYLSTTMGGIDTNAIDVVAGVKTLIKIADFWVTDYAAHRFLTIVNEGTMICYFTVTLL